MKKYHISTTISLNHWAMLTRLTKKFGTQQKVLEFALENLENNQKLNRVLTSEEKIWLMLSTIKSVCIIQKDGLKSLIETANIERFTEYTACQRPLEYVIEYYYQKTLKECSLKDIIEGLVINGKISHSFDTYDYTDDGDHYTLKMTHSFGLNGSKMFKIMTESVFNTYGVKNESKISERSVFIKVFKNT